MIISIAALTALMMLFVLCPVASANADLYLPTIANGDTTLNAAGTPVDFAVMTPRL